MCSHAFQDKAVRAKNRIVGVLTVAPYWNPWVKDDELAGTHNTMYPGRTYVCINCGYETRVPGKWRPSRFLVDEIDEQAPKEATK